MQVVSSVVIHPSDAIQTAILVMGPVLKKATLQSDAKRVDSQHTVAASALVIRLNVVKTRSRNIILRSDLMAITTAETMIAQDTLPGNLSTDRKTRSSLIFLRSRCRLLTRSRIHLNSSIFHRFRRHQLYR